MVVIGNFQHFVTLADSLRWDDREIDLAADRAAWSRLTASEHDRVLGLVAGFCIAETSTSALLGTYRGAATEDSMATAFAAQARDESRHARFFDTVAAVVAGVPGATPAHRREVLRARVRPELVDLFEQRLPDTARRLAEGRTGLGAAVGFHHLAVQAVVLPAGQHAMLDVLEGLPAALPGLRRGVELVLRDEDWHIGFGTRVLQTSGLGREAVSTLLEQGECAAKTWGDLTTPEAIDTAVRTHRRRLRASGIAFR